MTAGFEFNFTTDKLEKIIPDNPHLEDWFNALTSILPEYEINTPRRVASFLAQTAHESAGYKTLKENLNYRAEALVKLWPSRFPSIAVAKDYAHNPEKIANRAYASKTGNGPESSGDGWKFKGRGLIQLAGKSNYEWFADSIDMSVEEVTDYLETFEGAVQSACWFWDANELNKYADEQDLTTMTQKINGGLNGLEDRKLRYNYALNIL